MEYFQEVLDRSSGELAKVSQGEWITITELGKEKGVGSRQVRAILREMGILTIEGPGRNARHRLAAWVTERGYRARLSGPLLDRIDLHIEVPAVTAADLLLAQPGETSAAIAARVAAARARQRARYAALGVPARTNAEAGASLIEDVARPDAAGQRLLQDAAEAMRLSARGYHRVLKVARTIADLDGVETVGRLHLAEALAYRALVDGRAAVAA